MLLSSLGHVRLLCHLVLCNGNSPATQTLLTHCLCSSVTFIFSFSSVRLFSSSAADLLRDSANSIISPQWPRPDAETPYIHQKATWKQITDGLNTCNSTTALGFDHPPTVDLTLNELTDWLTVWRIDWLWYHGRRGGADRIDLTHLTSPPSSYLSIEDWSMRITGCPPAAVPWCIYTCKSRISHTEGCFYGYPCPG